MRKLKGLGLTTSYPIGYELTELGVAYMDHAAGLEMAFDQDEP